VATAEDELRSYLDPGEKLLWEGRPKQGIVFTPLDWYFIPFSLVWFGLVVYIFWQGLRKTLDPMGVAMSVFFIGIGTYFLIGRFFADAFYRSRLVYGIMIGEPSSRRAYFVALCNRSIYPRSVV